MAEENSANDTQIKLPQNKLPWIIGAIVLLVAGWFSYKALISSVEDYKVTLVDAPKQVESNAIGTFTWRVDGPPTTINHTSVHLGTTSNLGDLGKEVKPADTKYTEMVSDFANGNYNIPLQFVGNIKMMGVGKYYFRVHASVKDKNYWSDEYSLDVVKATTVSGEYRVTLLYPPKSVALNVLPKDIKDATMGGVVNFTWRLDGPPATINHTAVHFGLVSNPGILGQETVPADTKYTDMVTDFAKGNYNIPLQFVGNTKITTAGTYYFRAHAMVAGKNIWTDEFSFTAK